MLGIVLLFMIAVKCSVNLIKMGDFQSYFNGTFISVPYVSSTGQIFPFKFTMRPSNISVWYDKAMGQV